MYVMVGDAVQCSGFAAAKGMSFWRLAEAGTSKLGLELYMK